VWFVVELWRWTGDFCNVADAGGCREGNGGWMSRRGMSGNALGCQEEALGVWRGLVGCGHWVVMEL
jgi:hypothetical protein